MKPALLALVLCLSACAPGETVTVRLVTGLERNSPAPNLLETLSRNPEMQTLITTDAYPCIQSDIRAGFGIDGTNEVAGIPVQVVTNSSIQNATVFWGVPNSAISSLSFPEIRLQLPRNVPLSVGIIGSITKGPADVAGGRCRKFSPPASSGDPPFIPSTFSMFGAREFPNGVSNETEIPLNVWGILSSIEPSSEPCSNGDCPRNRFVKILTGTTDPAQVRIRYFAGRNISFDQYLNFNTSAPVHYIPRSGLAQVQMRNASSWVGCTANGSAAIDLESTEITIASCSGAGCLEFVPLF